MKNIIGKLQSCIAAETAISKISQSLKLLKLYPFSQSIKLCKVIQDQGREREEGKHVKLSYLFLELDEKEK